MRKTKHTNVFIVFAIFILMAFLAFSATPEKPYPAVQEGDRLHASWLMGMFNVIYDWAQTTNNDFAQHVASSTAHGVTGEVVGTTDTQSLTNKTLDSSNSIAGEAIKSGTVADERIASTIARDSEITSAITTHNSQTAAHGITGEVVGTTDTQSLTNKTLDSSNSIAGEAIKSGTVADERIASTIARDSEITSAITTHNSQTAAHGITGNVVGTTDSQTVTNKAMGAGCTWGGTAVPVLKGGTGATTAADARTKLGVAYGTTAGTVCQGNDARLSDARAPTAHTHSYAGSSSAGGAATTALACTGNAATATTATTATTANKIRTSAPASPANGDIWVE